MPNGRPGGGGGGGILGVSGSFTGPSESLEIAGDHAYAYSGAVTTVGTGSANTSTSKFKTGNFYFVGTVSAQNDSTGDVTSFLAVSLNGIAVIDIRFDAASISAITMDFPLPIIIPPYTDVEVNVGVNTSSNVWTTQIVGRIYR